jgi:hypothetical protein
LWTSPAAKIFSDDVSGREAFGLQASQWEITHIKTVLSMRKSGPEVQEEMRWVEYVSFSPLGSSIYHETDGSRFLRNAGRTVLFNFISQSQNRIVTEEYYFLEYNAAQFVESQPRFRWNISSPSSGSNKPGKIKAWKRVARRVLSRRLTFNGVMSQKIELFIITAMRTSNPTQDCHFSAYNFITSATIVQSMKVLFITAKN